MKTRFILFASVFFIAHFQTYSQISAPSIETSFQNYLRSSSGNINTGSVLPTFMIKENTRGNRYLYENWVDGSVTGVNGVVYESPKFKYNYDKISRKLFLRMDTTTVIELSSGDIAGFNLKSDGNVLVFERLKNSTDLNFYQPVYKNEKGYSLYKLLTTKFNRADYQSNGIVESGNKYDEYVDTKEYFILSAKGELTKIIFKKKAIEKALEKESSKVDAFFSSHKSDKVDETFVKNLLESLNAQQ